MKPINERLIELRDSVGMNRQAFAAKVGIDQSTYSRYELGQTKPSLDTLEKISLTFPAIDARWLLTGQGEMKLAALPADQPAQQPTASPLTVVLEPEREKEYKETIRELREQNKFLRDLMRSGADLTKLASFNLDNQEAAVPMWLAA